MPQEDEIKRLRRLAADLVEQAERRDRAIAPPEDAAILRLLTEAYELEREVRQAKMRLAHIMTAR